jgi:hypothetical protein
MTPASRKTISSFQSCTEMVMPMCAGGPPDDFFWKECPFSPLAAADACVALFSSQGYDSSFYRPDWIVEQFGKSFPSASNIVFRSPSLPLPFPLFNHTVMAIWTLGRAAAGRCSQRLKARL